MAGFKITYRSEDGRTQVEDLDGVSWVDAPIPGRFHRCEIQTRGWINYVTEVFRCRCGAVGRSSGGSIRWIEKNSRKR